MGLSLVNNVPSLTATHSLNKTNLNLSRSLERLSTGLKVNRGVDGPAALVISERMRAQISGLKTALDNTNKAVSLIQVAEGALNEINSLLNKARSLALDSANAGINDDASLDANQAELANIIQSIDDIANRTQFNGRSLLNTTDTFTFQTGANDGETASIDMQDMQAAALGIDAIDIGSGGDTSAALTALDDAISTVSQFRATLGAFQANNLESNANTLRTALENTVSAESVIRDTDFATEIANFTKLQTQMQAGATVLGNANQMTALVAQLLRG
ncbi:MAG: flagellin [Gemmataceae bacterium]|nr:flagellin [Gemmata sp.]MDW8197068.1 flagellin [Gemmataceae bacterium]